MHTLGLVFTPLTMSLGIYPASCISNATGDLIFGFVDVEIENDYLVVLADVETRDAEIAKSQFLNMMGFAEKDVEEWSTTTWRQI